ncbi:thioredoxin family protein [Helicobacter sp.]|uniref:thioredoxin family protein n=1 Tax=Helicobacter sp. TaxID=218 RepID=UPI0025C6C760|nr:thioredoxin family protein [Helicobacter sp.]MBR2494748.1 thioredoxin family protein [Helicobacter sp.]
MTTATKQNFSSLIESGLCVVEMSAPWCQDCRKIEPIMQILESKYSQVRYISLDFDTNETLKDELAIRRIPTLIFYKDGQEVLERLIETDSMLTIEQMIQALLNI